jgi:hypothetical protein
MKRPPTRTVDSRHQPGIGTQAEACGFPFERLRDHLLDDATGHPKRPITTNCEAESRGAAWQLHPASGARKHEEERALGLFSMHRSLQEDVYNPAASAKMIEGWLKATGN